MKRFSRFAFFLLVVAAVGSFAPLRAVTPVSPSPGVKTFGKPLVGQPAVPIVSIEELVARPAAYAGRTIHTEGTIAAVCAKKGCWMTLGPGAAPIRVTFQDYGFFVPKDAAGATATLEGVFLVAKIPEATAKHYAGETPGGKPEAVRGEQQELSIVATGVELKGLKGGSASGKKK